MEIGIGIGPTQQQPSGSGLITVAWVDNDGTMAVIQFSQPVTLIGGTIANFQATDGGSNYTDYTVSDLGNGTFELQFGTDSHNLIEIDLAGPPTGLAEAARVVWPQTMTPP